MNGGGAASEPKVFICYRREDTAAHAGRLYDAMVAHFGERNVFMDVDIAPGVDFVERITRVVSGCLVLIVVMGRNWATAEDEEGRTRIADPDDFVRLEVETALKRPDVTPIPVLVSGARMPRPEDLPAELQPIARRNALELSDGRWRYDVGRLMSTLDELLEGITRPDRPVVAPPPPPRPSSGRLLLEGIVLAGVTALLARLLGELIRADDEIAKTILRRAETWAVVGAVLAVWLGALANRTDVLRLAIVGAIVGGLGGAIGGAIWAFPVHDREVSLLKTDLDEARWIEVGALAATGAFLGALIGSLWRPPHRAAGLVAGAAAGVLLQLVVIGTGMGNEAYPSSVETALGFGLAAAAMTGFSLLAVLLLDRPKSESRPPAYATAADP
jgi:TIR domain-containing protein